MPDPFASAELDDLSAEAPAPAQEDSGSGYWMLWLAAASLALSILTFLDDSPGVQVIGYLLAAPVPFTLIAFFRRHTTARLFTTGIGLRDAVSRAAWLMLIAGFVCSFFHALLFAQHYA